MTDPNVPTRARRVRVPIPIRYRRQGEAEWAEATVVNLSETGVLFNATELTPGTPVEVIISPPMQVGVLPAGKQMFEAEIVRTTGDGAVGARFGECWFLLEVGGQPELVLSW